MRAVSGAAASLAAALLAGCGAWPSRAPATPPPAGPQVVDARPYAVRGLPGAGPYRLLALAGPGVDEIELYGLVHAAVALGWQVGIGVPELAPLRGRFGAPIPPDLAVAGADPAAWDVLYVPAGAPASEPALALVRAFAAERHLAVTAGGAAVLRQAGVPVEGRLAADELGVHVDGNLLSAARPGDLPGLAHALEAYARDRLPRAP